LSKKNPATKGRISLEAYDITLFDPSNFQTILQQSLHFIAMCRFAIHAQNRFGAAKADQQPAAAFEPDMESQPEGAVTQTRLCKNP